MAAPDLTFLGEQIARLQSDLRGVKADVAQLRAEQLRLEADQAQLKLDLFERLDGLEKSTADGFEGVDVQFGQLRETMTTNLDVVLTAIKGK